MKKIVSTMFKCGAICVSINVVWGEGGKEQGKENCSRTPCSSPVKTKQRDLTKPLSPVWVGELTDEEATRVFKQRGTFLAEGGQGKVYACERYALKFLNPRISEKEPCQFLKKRQNSLISGELTLSERYFYEGCNDFITKYFGTYTYEQGLDPNTYKQFFNPRTGIPRTLGTCRTVVDPETGVKRGFGIREVSFFEKIDGEEFFEFKGELIQKCQLFTVQANSVQKSSLIMMFHFVVQYQLQEDCKIH